ncbi:MAG: sigma-70 family RNA polymerase sigma factor [Alphaproteobacteria bacterium]
MVHKKADNQNQVPADEIDFEAILCDIGKNRDKQSFVTLFEYFAPRIKSFLIKGGADEHTADELAQETMLNIWDKAKSYDPQKAAASTWIFTIARNKRIDALRKSKGYYVDLDDLPILEDDESPSPVQNLYTTQQMSRISKALDSLPEEQASLIRKSFFEDKSHQELAEETGIPLGTIKSRIRLGLERLRGDSKIKGLWS